MLKVLGLSITGLSVKGIAGNNPHAVFGYASWAPSMTLGESMEQVKDFRKTAIESAHPPRRSGTPSDPGAAAHPTGRAVSRRLRRWWGGRWWRWVRLIA